MPYGFNEDKSKFDLSALLLQLADDVAALESLQAIVAGKADAAHTHDASEVASGVLASARIPNLSTTKLTAGTLGFARGGTNSTGVTSTTEKASILTASSGVSIVKASFAQWGKIAQLDVSVSLTAAKSGSWKLGTVVSGKRPATSANAITLIGEADGAYIMSDGSIYVGKSFAKSDMLDLAFIYLLA